LRSQEAPVAGRQSHLLLFAPTSDLKQSDDLQAEREGKKLTHFGRGQHD
jgi:hypothetical protein